MGHGKVYSGPTAKIADELSMKAVFSKLIIMLSPIVPHFAEELWQALGNNDSIAKASWPEYDPAMLVEDTVTLIVQVNGKVRSRIDVAIGLAEDKVRQIALSDEKLKPWIEGKAIKKFIVVPDKIVNIVI